MTVATISHEPNLSLALFLKDYLEDYSARYAVHYAHYTTARYALKAHAPPLIPLVYKALSL